MTKSNYATIMKNVEKSLDKKTLELVGTISRLKKEIANKEKSYERVKEMVLNDLKLREHYDLDQYAKEIQKKKSAYTNAMKKKANLKSSIPTFEEYLKLITSTSEILGKIHDMQTMNTLLKFFFSNFTVKPDSEGTYKGSSVTYKLKEPWNGFLESNDFVLGAGIGTLTPARCCSPGFWTIIFLKRSRATARNLLPKKKPVVMTGFFFGAAEQNLLKLFQAIIEGTVSSPIVSEQNETKANLIIY